MHWLCKLFGHDFKYEPPLVYCQRCGEYKHNPFRSAGGVKNTDAEIRDGVWSDSTKAPGANIDAAISSRSSHSLADVEGEIQDETGTPSADNQTLYDILANADQGTLTTSGDSIADRIDDYISNAGVDPATVRREAGVTGFRKMMGTSQPREIATSVSGGSVTFDSNGAHVTAGTTSGDTAALLPVDWLDGPGQVGIIKAVIIFKPEQATPYGDAFRVGIDSGVTAGDGAVLNLMDGVYEAGGTTASATLPAQNEWSTLSIEVDFDVGETRFQQEGDVSESVTIGNVGSMFDNGTHSTSNGNGEEVCIKFIKLQMWGFS